MFFVMSSDDTPVCPVCGGTLKYRDTRLRIRKKEGRRERVSYDPQAPLYGMPPTSQRAS